MFKINAWVKDSNAVVRFIREGLENIDEVVECIKNELKDIETLEIHISKEI